MSEAHQGASAPGPLTQAPDRRINELNNAIRALEASASNTNPAGLPNDPLRGMQASKQRLNQTSFSIGMVVSATASLGWHKVQLGMGGWLPCCQLSQGGLLPLGPREVGAVPPNSLVLVHRPPGVSAFGIIIGVIPPTLRDGRIVNPDWITQGGQSGLRREEMHRYPIRSHFRKGGLIDWSGQRPVDATAFERGLMSITGIGLIVDDFQAYLRVHEHCGLFLSIFDGHARLAGNQLDISSLAHEESAKDDEGELRLFRGVATYAHEALGLYANNEPFTVTRDDRAVQFDEPYAKIDVPGDSPSVAPFYRWQEYGGYLGQGHVRMLALPPATEGIRNFRNEGDDEGLFCESIGIDGAYMLRSAKSISLVHRVLIVIPRQIRLPESPEGDDAVKDNYKFAGLFGSGPEHKLAEVEIPGDGKSMRRVAGIADLLAFGANWRTLHPFHYHKGDYSTPQESNQTDHFTKVQDPLDFLTLADKNTMRDPTPIKLRIDHRYKDVEYFQRESYLTFLDDGSVALGCGFGAQIVFTGGNVRIEAPGDVVLAPGRDAITLGDQIIVRARQSVDVSAAKHDVRIKAEKGMQLLAGNGGTGALLIESKANGVSQDFVDKIGEDVDGHGVIIRAAKSMVATLAGDIYLRTGGADMTDGNIIIDAAQGRKRIVAYCSNTEIFCSTGGVNFYYGPTGESSDVQATHSFKEKTCFVSANMYLGGRLTTYGDRASITVHGTIQASGSIASGGSVASQSGGFLGAVGDQFADAINRISDTTTDAVGKIDDAAEEFHQNFVKAIYGEKCVGNNDVVPAMGFTYRDDEQQAQYHTRGLEWLERRWEQIARFGGGTGGNEWKEPPVKHEGKELYPWPGKKKWQEDNAFLVLAEQTMFDGQKGVSRDRPGPYEKPKLADWKREKMSEKYKLVRKGD